MTVFVPTLAPRLYVKEITPLSDGWLGYLLPSSSFKEKNFVPPSEITLGKALSDLQGSFLFSAKTPILDTVAKAEAFVDQVAKILPQNPNRAFCWLVNLPSMEGRLLGFNLGGTATSLAMEGKLADTLSLMITSGCSLNLSAEGNSIEIQAAPQTDAKIQFGQSSAPNTTPILAAAIPFSGTQSGCLTFDVGIERDSMYRQLRWGFQFLIPDKEGKELAAWYPFANGSSPSPTDYLSFQVSVDLTDITNTILKDRTYFAFTGQNSTGNPTILNSFYQTNFGHLIDLTPVVNESEAHPSKFVFAFGSEIADKLEFLLSPEGDFELSIDPNLSNEPYFDLVCGLAGTETISFVNKDRIRFFSKKEAFAPNFPFKDASPVGPPSDPEESLLNPKYHTSWATILRKSSSFSNHYSAQPKSSSLYGQDTLIYPQTKDILGFMSPGYALPQLADFYFPMVPYYGVSFGDGVVSLSADTIDQIESQVISPTRRRLISIANAPFSPSPMASLFGLRSKGFQNVTTPSGLIANVDMETGVWQSLYLAQNLTPSLAFLAFGRPSLPIQQAFQTNELFLVVANAKNLGRFTHSDNEDSGDFFNRINIEDWVFEADIGHTNKYNDYNNVMIVKGKKGRLRDLIKNPAFWTQKNDFSIPGYLDKDQKLQEALPSELIIFSQWLQNYFEDAAQKTSSFFDYFNGIAEDESWTGILILKMNVVTLPSDLTPLLDGIDQKNFYVHHFGIEISQIDKTTISIRDQSSMFGLVYYVDKDYDPNSGLTSIPPPTGALYDFKVLTLQALFQNTVVKDFYSLSQLTMNEIFGQSVTYMGDSKNTNNTILLGGSYQNHNDVGTYTLDTLEENSFYFDSPILNKVEIIKAQLTSLEDAPLEKSQGAGGAINRFSLWGFIDFKVIEEGVEDAAKLFDIFSFGNASGDDLPRKGLRFSGLGINMASSEEDSSYPIFTFDPTKIAFDMVQSTPRAGSLYENFALQIEGLLTGGGEKNTPTDHGYLPVKTEIRLGGVKEEWYGLQFTLNMGSPGELAGKVNFNSSLLVAWSPTFGGNSQSPAVMLGIKLPGTGGGSKLLSIEGVMKLSIGDIQLTYVDDQKAFLLLFTNIALKFLGLLKIPPNGQTSFYLFGDPNAQGKAGKLGWYSVYNKQSENAKKSMPRKLGLNAIMNTKLLGH